MFTKEITGSKDAPKVEELTEDGITIRFEREGRHNLLHLESDGIDFPEKYSGKYTNIDYAKQAALQYLEDRKVALTEIKTEKKKRVA